MENIGGPQVYQVIDANMVEDLKQIYNLDNVQLVMSGGDDVYGQQVIQMQAPNQPELVVNESPQSSQQRAPQQIVYHSPDPAQTQTFVLQQTPERHIQQQVVMQRTPVNEERVTEQQVFYTELQTPQEQAQAALNQQVINAQQNHIQQQSPPQVIISSQPQSQLQFVTTNRPQETQQSSQPMTIIQQQPNQQYFLHTGSAPQQFYIQQEPNTQYTRVLYDSRMPQMQPRATLLIQEPPRIMQQPPTLRHVIQQQPQGQQVQLSQPTVQRIVPIRTSSPSKIIQAPFWPNNPGLIQTRARIVRPRVPRPSPAPGALGIVRTVSTPRARIVTSAGQQHPPPQNVRLSYVTTPTRQVAPPRMTLNRTVSPQNRVVLQTRPRAAMQSPARLPTTSPNPIMTIKKSPAPAKGASEDPDDIESNITAAIVSRKPDGTPILEPSPGPMEVKRVAVPRQPQAVKKLPVMGGQTPIIPAQLLAKQEEEPKERESAKMLVILQSGEQRLITFTLPKECCTVQELLEQVGVPFSADSNIQCISNPGADIDYVVTVGVTADTNELMVVTESTLKSPLTQPQPTQVQLQMQTTPPQMPPAPPKLHTVPPNVSNEPKPKFMKGYLAVCNYCGATSLDHARCQRCKREFKGDVKIVPIPQQAARQLQKNEGVEKKFHILKRGEAGEGSVRGRGTGRAKGGTRKAAKPEEPVIVTLSSDEETDASRSSSCNNSQGTSQGSLKNKSMYEPLNCEPTIPESNMNHTDVHKREDIGTGKEVFSFKCKAIRIGQHKFEAKERVVVSDKGIKLIAPGVKSKDQGCSVLHIQTHEIVKVLINTKTNHGVLFLFVLPSCGAYLRENLEMSSQSDGKSLAFNPLSRDCSVKHIVFHLACEGDTVLGAFKKALLTVEEIAAKDVTELIKRIEKEPPRTPVSASNDGKQILVYPQGKGGIPIYIDDYLCLAIDQYLNDVIIDFYLKFLMAEKLTEEQREKTHVFSTFFYKRLTTLERTRQKFMDKDLKLTAAKKRHLRVKNWTKNVDLFKKDFIIIPINEQSHWFLAIVCFPHLKGPVTVEGNRPVKTALAKRIKKASTKNKMLVQIGNTTITPVKKEDLINVAGDESERDEAEGDDSEFNSEDSGEEDTSDPESQPIKQPCILIFDSLAGTSRTRVTATIRDYLTCEFASKTDGEGPVFNRDNLPGHYVKVPQQNNFTDCGLYLLQYVEQFFLDPIKDYRLPLKGLVNWFESLEATKKREDIANLLNDLIKKYQPNNLPLPELEFPTIGGKLIETDEVGDFDEGAETDHFEDSEWTMDESGRQVTTTPQQVKITRQIKFQKRTSDDKLIYKIPLKQARLEESSSST